MPSLLAIRNPLADAKDTLSSWDKCMAKAYCKWPVIVAIIVGSLIILSLVLCVARCVCCGAELACCCFKCCSCCCGGSGRSGKSHKRVKSDPLPPVYNNSAYSSAPPAPSTIDTRPQNQQYRSHAAPTFNPVPAPTLASKSEPPQFARFDAHSKPANDDALPAMPSWGDARSHHVEEEVIPEKRGDVELERLQYDNANVAGSAVPGAAAVGAARRSPGPRMSPVQRNQRQDSYGFPPGYQNDSFVGDVPRRNAHTSPGPYNQPYGQQQDPYREVSPVQSLSPVYGAGAGYAQNQQYDRRSPGPGYGQQQQHYDRRSRDTGYNQQQQHYDRRSPDTGYNQQQQQFRRPSPAQSSPPANPYGYSNPQHQEQDDGYAPAPARSPSPVGYAPSGSTRYEPSIAPSYPGQRTYASSEASHPGQPTYRAYTPVQPQGQQHSGVTRKAVEGSWKEV